MDVIQIFVLALVQGFTEFLPISSSAHLILIPQLFGWFDQGLAFDVAVHVGTLLAVIYYFRNDLKIIFKDFFKSIRVGKAVGESNIVFCIIIATIPASIVGFLLNDYIENYLRNPLIIASTTIIFGIVLYIADKKIGQFSEKNINFSNGFIIGLAQVLALIPGVSRSGITMTAALFLGYTREASARFSFLLSIPIIILAGGYKALKLIQSSLLVDWFSLGLGILLSAISAYICICFFLNYIQKASMNIFVMYRVILGLFLFYIFL